MLPLAEATEMMKTYQWGQAAELCQKALDGLDPAKDSERAAEITSMLSKCHFNAAFQSENREDFQRTMTLSRQSSEKAAVLYERASIPTLAKKEASKALFAGFWLQDRIEEKRSLMQRCIPQCQQAAHEFQIQGDRHNLAETLLELLVYYEETIHLAEERRELVNLFESAVETAWRIIEEFESTESEFALESMNVLVRMYLWAESIIEPPRYEELEKRLAKLKESIPRLSEKIGALRAQLFACEALHILAGDLDGDIPKALGLFEEALSKAKVIGDHYALGRLNTIGSVWVRYLWLNEENAEKRRENLERALELASQGIRNLQSSQSGLWLKRAYGMHAEAFTYLATTVETDIDRKRALLRKAIETGRKGMRYERHSFVLGSGHDLSKALYFLATTDVGLEEKASLLSEAIPIREEIVKILQLLCPHSWNRGVALNYLALLKSELSRIQNDKARRLELLQGAASDMQQCLQLCTTLAGIVGPVPGQLRVQAQYNEWHGDILQQLYEITNDISTARMAITAYDDTISYVSKSESVGPIPPIRWKIARTHDSLREYKEASESFHKAAEEYSLAAKKLVDLGPSFLELAQYMLTWSLIEDARLSHDKELYIAAAETYTKAANQLRETKTFNHLSKHYAACSFLELGESLSRQERQHAAIESFGIARETFEKAKSDLDVKHGSLLASQEKAELKEWLNVNSGRLRYSLGRSQLEEAKLLDARMEEEASSAMYRKASQTFEGVLLETRHDPTRAELETLRLLCDAWAKMKAAEARASSELYAEAANSFSAAEKTATGKRFRLAALANASMCKALEAGSVFRRSRDKGLYGEIKKRLEVAAGFYEEAEIKKAADWTRGTERFFDALTYLGEAETETEPKKRTELYHLAEKHLQLAAKLFGDAGFTRKREETLRHLASVREEKQILLSPIEVLAESPTVGEVALAPVTFSLDRAVGLERFEGVNLVGNLNVSEREVHAGETIELELRISNMGKSTAMLLRLENLPTKGLEPVRERGRLQVGDNALSLGGKRLEYLKTYQEKLTLRAKRKGTYELRPRVVFVDEKGHAGSRDLEPFTITVRELGVLGWVKGPGT